MSWPWLKAIPVKQQKYPTNNYVDLLSSLSKNFKQIAAYRYLDPAGALTAVIYTTPLGNEFFCDQITLRMQNTGAVDVLVGIDVYSGPSIILFLNYAVSPANSSLNLVFAPSLPYWLDQGQTFVIWRSAIVGNTILWGIHGWLLSKGEVPKI